MLSDIVITSPVVCPACEGSIPHPHTYESVTAVAFVFSVISDCLPQKFNSLFFAQTVIHRITAMENISHRVPWATLAVFNDDTTLSEILEVLGAPKNSTRAQVQHLAEVAMKMAKSLKYQADKIKELTAAGEEKDETVQNFEKMVKSLEEEMHRQVVAMKNEKVDGDRDEITVLRKENLELHKKIAELEKSAKKPPPSFEMVELEVTIALILTILTFTLTITLTINLTLTFIIMSSSAAIIRNFVYL